MKIGLINLLSGFQFIYLSIINGYESYISLLIFNITLILYLLPKLEFFIDDYRKFYFLNYVITVLSLVFYNFYILFLGIPIFFEYSLKSKSKVSIFMFGILVIEGIRNLSVFSEYILIPILSCYLVYKEFESGNLLSKLKEENTILKVKNEEFIREIDLLKSTSLQIEYNAKLNERNIISQKLHDKIGHTITGSLIQLEAIKLLIKEDIKVSNMLGTVINSLREGMGDIRGVLKSIKPNKVEISINKIRFILSNFNLY